MGSLCVLESGPKLGDLVSYVTCIILKSVIPLIFALAVAMFVWGVVMYVINTSEEAKKAKGKMFMIWGIIALTVMVSVWGLVAILGNTFGITTIVPQLPGTSSTGGGALFNNSGPVQQGGGTGGSGGDIGTDTDWNNNYDYGVYGGPGGGYGSNAGQTGGQTNWFSNFWYNITGGSGGG
ncbi:MAG: hypothetical protein WC662_03305, partial [Candidatus Paceibacterota bacterium]